MPTITIAGTAYNDRGVTPMGVGRTIAVSVNGAAAALTALTLSDGTYLTAGLTVVAGDVLTIYLQGNTEIGAVVTHGTGSNMTGVDVWGNCLVIRSDDGLAFTGANLVTSKANAASGITGVYGAASATNTSVVAPCDFVIASGHTYSQSSGSVTFRRGVYLNGTMSGAVTFSGNNQGTAGNGTFVGGGQVLAVNITINKSGNTLTIGDNFTLGSGVNGGVITATAGTIDLSNRTVTFGTSPGAVGLSGAGSFTTTGSSVVVSGNGSTLSSVAALPTVTVAAVGTVSLGAALTVTGALTINSGSTLALAGNNLTVTGATFVNSGTLSLRGSETLTGFTNDTANGGTVTYVGTGTVSYAGLVAGNSYRHLTFNGSGRTWLLTSDVTITGNLTRTAGRFLDGGLTVNVGGNWVNTAGVGAFVLTGTTTFTGTAQTISGTTTFSTLVMTTGGDVVTFTDGTTTTVDTAFTAQNVTLRGSSTGGWTIAVPAAQTIDHVTVSYSTATGNTAAAGPTSTDGGHNVNWTFGSPPPPPSSVVNQQLPLLMGQ